ncbi:MAG: hypothetical protein BGO43_05655 [Gammaproteobacteria bacterium 39-13]|nr:response regulator [Gammaproteobacteria bacterium]OJV91523.1 MAG: hypothetical protein BGO43_05655 [Gammaproteobacteria bacterium 39-13]
MKEKSVLFIDDEENILKTLKRQLNFYGYKVHTAMDAANAFSILEHEEIPVIVSDQKMPNISGSELLAQIKENYPKTVRMIISGYTDFNALQEAVNKGEIYKFIPKPWDERYLLDSLERAFQYYEELEANEIKDKVLDNALEAIALSNLEHTIESANNPFLMLTGYNSKEIMGKNIWQIFNFSAADISEILEEVSTNKIWQGETTLITKKHAKLYGTLLISEFSNKQNHQYHSFSFMHFPELRAKDLALKETATHDEDTDLLNRDGFEEHLATLIFSKQDLHPLFVVALYFENLNSLSNAFGTTFLRNAASYISSTLKNAVNAQSYARLSPNIFAFAIGNNIEEQQAKAIIMQIRNFFKETIDVENHSFRLVPFIGVSFFPQTNIASTLIDRSILCAQYSYESKNNEVFYSDEIEHEMKELLFQKSEGM